MGVLWLGSAPVMWTEVILMIEMRQTDDIKFDFSSVTMFFRFF